MVAVTPLAPPPSRAHMWAFGYADFGDFLGMSAAAVKKASQRRRVDLGSLESVVAFRASRRPRAVNGSVPARAIVWKRVKKKWVWLGELALAEIRVDGRRWQIDLTEARLSVRIDLARPRRVVLDVVGPMSFPVRVRGLLSARRFEGVLQRPRRRG
jgi:hypothetical protein